MNTKGVTWRELKNAPIEERCKGIRARPLWKDENSPARASVLEIDASFVWKGIDLHEPGPEEIYVVSGVFNDGVRDYPAGTFIHNPASTSHIPQSQTGCTLFVFFPEG